MVCSDAYPYFNAGVAYGSLGQYENAVETTRRSLELYPENVTAYENLGTFYLQLNRLTEAKDITKQALARKLDEEILHTNLYSLAFLQGDSSEMIKQAAWFEGKTDVENEIFGQESSTEAYCGRLKKARELTEQAVASAERAQNKEVAAFWTADGALREAFVRAFFGAAREKVDEALKKRMIRVVVTRLARRD